MEASDYVTTLLREPVASHLLEQLVSLCSPDIFDLLWRLYFEGKVQINLGNHVFRTLKEIRKAKQVSGASCCKLCRCSSDCPFECESTRNSRFGINGFLDKTTQCATFNNNPMTQH